MRNWEVYLLQGGREKLSSARLMREGMGSGQTPKQGQCIYIYTSPGQRSWEEEDPGPHLVLLLEPEKPAHLLGLGSFH